MLTNKTVIRFVSCETAKPTVFATLLRAPASGLPRYAQAQARHPARQARAHPRRGRALLRPRRVSPLHHAGHLQRGRDQPWCPLRLLLLEGRPHRRHHRARSRKARRPARRAGEGAGSHGGAGVTSASTTPIDEPQYKSVLCIEIGCEATRNPVVGEIYRSVDNFCLESFKQLFARAQAEGKIAPELDTETIAQVIAVIGDGLFWRRAVDPNFDAAKLMPAIIGLVRTLLNPSRSSGSRRAPNPPQTRPPNEDPLAHRSARRRRAGRGCLRERTYCHAAGRRSRTRAAEAGSRRCRACRPLSRSCLWPRRILSRPSS